MASLLARHQKSCELGKPWSSVDYTARSFKPQKEQIGCTCAPGPTFYVVAAANGAGGRRSAGRNFENAKRQLTKIQGGLNDGEDVALKDTTFGGLVEEWTAWLKSKPGGPKLATLRSYVSTIEYGKEAFNGKPVRKITAADVERFLGLMARERRNAEGETVLEPLSASTRLKHLRVLSSIFKFAAKRRYCASNPVADLDLRPKKERHEAAYFTDDEIPVLLASVGASDRPLIEFALLTGMRLGELVALRWGNVNLSERVVYVHEAYTDGIGINEPKTKGSRRPVRLSSEAVGLLGGLWSEHRTDRDIVFPPSPEAPTLDGYRRGNSVLKHVLLPAIKKAGIPRSGEHLDPPTTKLRNFHSLRHTYARLVLENGGELSWLSRQMGHSSEAVTRDVYGHWSQDAAKRQVDLLEKRGAFNFAARQAAE